MAPLPRMRVLCASLLLLSCILRTALSQSQSPPACLQTCLQGALANAAQSGCSSGDTTCACQKVDFGFGVRDCANQACSPTDAQAAISYAASLCKSALGTSTTGTPSGSPSVTGSVSQSFSVAPSTTPSNGNSSPTQASPGAVTGPTVGLPSPTTTSLGNDNSGGSDNNGTKIAIGVGVGVGVFALIGVVVAIWYARRSKKQKEEIKALREQQALNEERKHAQYLDGNPRSELPTIERPVEMGQPTAYVDGYDVPRGGKYVNSTPVEMGHGR